MSTGVEQPRTREGIAPRWVLLGLVLSLVAALLVAAYLYRRYVAFDRRAAEHLVADPALVVRLDLEHVALYSPFHERLLPLVTQGQKDASMKPRLTRLRQRAGVELGVDIRELVYSRGPTGKNWAVAVSGMFPPRGVVRGIHEVLREEGRNTSFDPALGRLRFDNGALLQEAADSVLVFASDPETLTRALAPTQRYEALALGKAKPSLSVVVRGAFLGGPAGRDRQEWAGYQLNASLDKSAPDQLTLDLRSPESKPAKAAEIAGLVAPVLAVPESSLKFVVSGPNVLQARVQVSGDNLARAADHLALLLRESAFSAP